MTLATLLFAVLSFGADKDSTSMVSNAMALSPDGKILSVAVTKYFYKNNEFQKTISKVVTYSTDDGKQVHAVAKQAGTVNAIVFNPSGSQFIVCAENGSATLWDTKAGRLVDSLDRRTYDGVRNAVFNKSGTMVATLARGKVSVWDVAARKLKYSLPHTAWTVRSARFSDDDKFLETLPYYSMPDWSESYSVSMIWEMSTGRFLRARRVLNFNADEKNPDFMSPDSIKIGSSDIYNLLRVASDRSCDCPGFTATATSVGVRIWDPKTLTQKKWFDVYESDTAWLAGMNCEYLLTSNNLYKLPTFEKIAAVKKLLDNPNSAMGLGPSVAFSANGTRTAALFDDQNNLRSKLKVFDAKDGRELFSVDIYGITDL